ncbi:polysaccharide pyruvyl transferase family protein [Siccirubricoccus phaeus]|uniref:polysaccharide pyruvyl transferase family protein n=1 Tax=Siccirubricoccus phaeus TaxID=2595053 RepID=UPI00165B3067|nr:polysaccharide pyruvyl transferase family protein [Siccirubricoccus phaeus]
MIAFAHIHRTKNVGDRMCTPALYFQFPEAQVFNINDRIPPCDAVIFGGGAIEFAMRGEEGAQRKVEARRRIAWGIGSSQHGTERHPAPPSGLDLIGLREYGRKGGEYVPCVSCMSEHFDKSYDIAHDAVLFVNYDKKLTEPNIQGIPKSYNDGSLAETIAFLASGAVVVTNSYHGAYWATLLGRKVVCLPYSSKFFGYKYPPTMATEETWRDRMREATAYPEALQDCRAHNLSFYNKVQDLLQ